MQWLATAILLIRARTDEKKCAKNFQEFLLIFMIQFRVRPLRIQNLLLYVDDPIRSIFGIARDFLSSLIIFDFREMDYWQREHYFYFVVLFRQPVFDLTTIDLDQRNKTLALRHSGTQP